MKTDDCPAVPVGVGTNRCIPVPRTAMTVLSGLTSARGALSRPNTGFVGAMVSKRIVGGGYNRVKLVGHCFEEFVMSANSAPNPGLALTIDRTENETIVHCSGRIVSDTVSSLRDMVKPLLSKNHTVVLDLTDTNYMDSSGLGVIVGLYVSSKAAGSELRLINLNNRLKELFSITRLGEVIARGRDPNELVLP